MIFTYLYKVSDELTIFWGVDRTALELASIEILNGDGMRLTDVFEIDTLKIPSTFYDERIDITPIKIKSIGTSVFKRCRCSPIHIKNLEISKEIKSLKKRAFECDYVKIDNIIIPEGITAIPQACFAYNIYLESIHLPSTLKRVSPYAFYSTPNLSEVIIPEKCYKIDMGAFYGSGIKKISLSDNIKTIGKSAFYGCSNLEQIVWPASCDSISENCFYQCRSLKTIIFHSTIKMVEANAFLFSAIDTLDFSESVCVPTGIPIDDGIKIIKPYYSI